MEAESIFALALCDDLPRDVYFDVKSLFKGSLYDCLLNAKHWIFNFPSTYMVWIRSAAPGLARCGSRSVRFSI